MLGLHDFEGKVDVQKEALRFRENFDNKCVSFIQLTFSFIVVIWISPQ